MVCVASMSVLFGFYRYYIVECSVSSSGKAMPCHVDVKKKKKKKM